MVEFIKTCDQYPLKFNFDHFYRSIILLPPFCWGKDRFSENAVQEECVISFCLEVITRTYGKVLLRGMRKKWTDSFLTRKCTSNLNTKNLKLFCNHGGIYRFKKKFKKYSGKTNTLGVHRNIRGCILEINCEGLVW